MKSFCLDLSERESYLLMGANNCNIDLLKGLFPALNFISGRSSLKVEGQSEVELRLAEKLFRKLLKNLGSTRSFVEKHAVMDAREGVDFYEGGDPLGVDVRGKSVYPVTAQQAHLASMVKVKDLVFATGVAGTGKTFVSVALAIKALKERQVRRVVLTRPAVEAGENLGFLPGDFKEKLDPYMQPLYDALQKLIFPEKLKFYLDEGVIQIAPLAFMRGRTLDHAFVILDEAQNTTVAQMKMFLTRMGKGAKFIVCGDPGQVDLKRGVTSGLSDALDRLNPIPEIAFIPFGRKEVMRHSVVRAILKQYDE